jgi:soluble lytic murein transglycosylase
MRLAILASIALAVAARAVQVQILAAFFPPHAPPPLASTAMVTVASHSPAPDGSPRASDRLKVYDEVQRRTGRLALAERTQLARAILEESRAAALDPLLVVALIHVESGFDPHAKSRAGALGLMQLMPPTMREEVALSRLASGDPLDAVANVRAGIRYFARLLNAFEDLDLALMAYNAGPARVRAHLRAGAVPRRLRAYPRAVLGQLARLSARPHEPVAAGPAGMRLASVRGSGTTAALCVSGVPLFLPLRPLRLDRHADVAS